MERLRKTQFYSEILNHNNGRKITTTKQEISIMTKIKTSVKYNVSK